MRNITIKSSIVLSESQKLRLEEGLTNKIEDQVNFSYEIDSIVGGIIVADGDKLFDASINNEIIKLRKNAETLVNNEYLASIKNQNADVETYSFHKTFMKNIGKILDKEINLSHCGKVISIADGILKIEGLSTCQYNELLLVGKDNYAIAMNLEVDSIGAICLGDYNSIQYGDTAYSTGKIVEVPVGESLLGRIVNPLGEPIDGIKTLHVDKTRRIESDAPMILDREKVNKPLSTGILAIDSMVPIGRGQRELIIGDRQTGKTAIAIDTIINQKGKNVICVYVAIGQRASTVNKIVNLLKKHDALKYTVLVVSTADDTAPLQYIAPYSGCAIAEEFMYQGRDVLIVYDDLSKHAVAYRSISLLLKRPSGREAYPGDIFYVHSRLLERSAKLSQAKGGGSITALPIIETLAGDISQYIPTNVISITDGQIYLEKELFNSGIRPAVNVGLSVSRVGGSAQIAAIRKLSSKMRLDLAHYRELAVFSQFGSDLDQTTKEILLNGEKTTEALKQAESTPMDVINELLRLYVIVNSYLIDIPTKKIAMFLDSYCNDIRTSLKRECNEIIKTGIMSPETESKIKEQTIKFVDYYIKENEEN